MTIDAATQTMPYHAPLGAGPAGIDTPALLLDHAKLIRNIARMAAFAAGGPARLRPHSKTHKCVEIARLQLDAGATGITCAKLGEAEALADGGIADILIANQIVGPIKIARLIALARRCAVTVAVDDAGNVAQLSAAARCRSATVTPQPFRAVRMVISSAPSEPSRRTTSLKTSRRSSPLAASRPSTRPMTSPCLTATPSISESRTA